LTESPQEAQHVREAIVSEAMEENPIVGEASEVNDVNDEEEDMEIKAVELLPKMEDGEEAKEDEPLQPASPRSDVETQTPRRPSSSSSSSADESSGSSSLEEGDDDDGRWESRALKNEDDADDNDDERVKSKRHSHSTNASHSPEVPSLVDAGVQSDEVMSVSSGSEAEVEMWREKYDTLNTSMEKLTQKFLAAMRQNAELEDKASRLEHVVEQLEGETETIGDYITLYHAQRKSLKTRSEEKDAQIVALVREKQFMQDRVGELQRLILESGVVTTDYHHRQSIEVHPRIAPMPMEQEEEVIILNEAEENVAKPASLGQQEETKLHTLVDKEANVVAYEPEVGENLTNGFSSAQVLNDMSEFMSEETSLPLKTNGVNPEIGVVENGQSSQEHDEQSDGQNRHRHASSPFHQHHHHPISMHPDSSSSLASPSKKDTELARIRQILLEMAGTVGNEADNFANLQFYPCKCCHGRLMNV